MADIDIDTALEWRGRTVVDRAGEKIGTLRDIYLDERERPHWGSVRSRPLAARETLVPLTSARLQDDVVQLPFDRSQVEEAPAVDPDVQLSADGERRLYEHYGVEQGSGPPAGAEEPGVVAAGSESGGAEATTGEDAMTRSEEEVRFGTRSRERGRARLKKYVVTDYVEKKVPVKREEVRLEYEPADEPADGEHPDG